MTASQGAVVAAPSAQVQQIPIGQLFPSEFNPRKTIDPAFLAQLADSIQQLGVQVPLLVRFIGVDDGIDGEDIPGVDIYGIVAGHRRFAAARKLGLETLPCIVRAMSDDEALQVMIVENLQRVDLSPMEEADGYRVLIRAMGDPDPQACVEEIARKSGKPASYVRSRLKLLALIAPAQEALREQLITFDAALLIAKLEPADQDRATARALNLQRGAETAQQALDGVRANIADDKEWRQEHPDEDEEPAHELLPVAKLKAWIAENILLDLANAPWSLDDAGILPEAGPCTTCPKRAGSDQALFADLTAKQDVCTDPACFGAKKKAFVQIQRAAAKASGKPLVKISDSFSQAPIKEGSELEKTTFKSGQWVASKKGDCADTYRGLTSEGELRWVCVNQRCKVHKHKIEIPAARGVRAEYDRIAKEREITEEVYRSHEPAIWEAILAAILGALDAASAVRLVAHSVHGNEEIRKQLLKRFPKSNGPLLEALVVFAAHFGQQPNTWYMATQKNGVAEIRKDLWALAKSVGVNADAIAAKYFSEKFTDHGSVISLGAGALYPKGVSWPKKSEAPSSAAAKAPAKLVKASPARKAAKATKPKSKAAAKKGGKR